MLFEYRLKPVHKIAPFGTAPELRLPWYGFTDGFYRLRVGDEYLCQYTPEVVHLWGERYSLPETKDWVDYYLAALWQDLLYILPTILNPLLSQISRWMTLDSTAYSQWFLKLHDWEYEQNHGSLFAEETVKKATSWFNDHGLHTSYLLYGPIITLWSDHEQVYIRWESNEQTPEGVQVWTSTGGLYSLPRHEFIQEVEVFGNSLMAQMAVRVDDIVANWSKPEIDVDKDGLVKEQQQRVEEMKATFQKIKHLPVIDWQPVMDAIQLIGAGFPGE